MIRSRAIVFTLALTFALASVSPLVAKPTAAKGDIAAAHKALPPLPFDHIMKYKEMTALLHAWAAVRPDLMHLESLGKTPQGRQMWFITLTRFATGPASDKPAIVVDGNMHATEWAGGVAALDFVWKLLREDGKDPNVTRVLDTRTVYVLPRMSPDGVDETLDQGRFIRSVARAYPTATGAPGIHPEDIDGDGHTVFMRYRDPNGPWKEYAKDPRLMVPRGPEDYGGTYWRVLPEGMIKDYNGVTIADPLPTDPLDFGANFPSDLRGTPRSVTAGPYPLSEPEVAAYVAAIARHKNIVAHVTCHTFGGLILTPPVNLGEKLPKADRQVYATLSGKAAKLTGYRAMSYLALRSDEKESFLPSAFAWVYDQRGIFSFITEFWNPLRAAGISLKGTTESAWLWGFHSVADEVKLLKWSDDELGGKGFIPWHKFDHPQLGPVEIGGFDLIRYWYNIPFDRLQKEVEPHSTWLVYLALSTPRLAIRSLSAKPVGHDLWRVRLIVENRGWLPTNGSQQALFEHVSRGVHVKLELPAGASFVEGAPERALGELQGRDIQRSTATWWGYTPGTPDRAFADWVVKAPKGATISAVAHHDRAGTVHATLVLGSATSQAKLFNH